MTQLVIPVRPDLTKQLMELVLNGTNFRLRFLWNSRQESWSIDVMTPDDVLISAGGKITPDWNPFRNIVREGMPLGRFVNFDIEGVGTMPTQLEFGPDGRVIPLYEEAA